MTTTTLTPTEPPETPHTTMNYPEKQAQTQEHATEPTLDPTEHSDDQARPQEHATTSVTHPTEQSESQVRPQEHANETVFFEALPLLLLSPRERPHEETSFGNDSPMTFTIALSPNPEPLSPIF